MLLHCSCWHSVIFWQQWLTCLDLHQIILETLQEIIHVSFIKLLCMTQNKIQKLESELLKPYLKT